MKIYIILSGNFNFNLLIKKSNNTPEYKEGFISLIKHIASISDQWIIDNVGLDAG